MSSLRCFRYATRGGGLATTLTLWTLVVPNERGVERYYFCYDDLVRDLRLDRRILHHDWFSTWADLRRESLLDQRLSVPIEWTDWTVFVTECALLEIVLIDAARSDVFRWLVETVLFKLRDTRYLIEENVDLRREIARLNERAMLARRAYRTVAVNTDVSTIGDCISDSSSGSNSSSGGGGGSTTLRRTRRIVDLRRV